MEDTDLLLKLTEKLLENETSQEVIDIKNQILRRIAMESDVKPSRIPAPMNITEIGGYINLMRELKQDEEKERQAYSDMLKQTLTSILGLPMQAPIASKQQ